MNPDRRLPHWILALLLSMFASCTPQNTAQNTPPSKSAPIPLANAASPLFADTISTSGIDFSLHQSHSPQTIQETLGHGVALGDFEGTGLLDIVLLGPDRVRLYRNWGGYRFEDITASSGLRQAGFWQGIAVGDYDNDGKPDLYLCGYNCSALYHNEGGGHFREVTQEAGLASLPLGQNGVGDWRTSAGFADLDNDGRLDLYVCRYVEFGAKSPQFCDNKTLKTACSPEIYTPQRGILYRNLGGGRFENVTAKSGLITASGNSLGVAFGDYNESGRPSIALANDERPGDLFENQGNFHFVNRGAESGTALSASGHNQAGMGIDWHDINGDGKPDLFVTTFENEGKPLYLNQGEGQFTDAGTRAGLTGTLNALVSFGCKFFDYDNDGLPDLIVASGHVNDNTTALNAGTAYAQPVLLFRNGVGCLLMSPRNSMRRRESRLSDGVSRSAT